MFVTRNLEILLEYFRGHSPNDISLGAHLHF